MYKFLILFLFLFSTGTFSSDFLECNFKIQIKELISQPNVSKTASKNFHHKAKFLIKDVDLTENKSNSHCQTFKAKTIVETLRSRNQNLKLNSNFNVKYTSITSEVVENGKVVNFVTNDVWAIQD